MIKLIQQATILLAVSIAGTALSLVLPFPFPATVCSMAVLLVFLVSGVIRVQWINELCDMLTRNMAWFLVPLGANAAQTFSIWWPYWWKILLIAIVMSIPTFLATQLTVRFVFVLQRKLRGKNICR